MDDSFQEPAETSVFHYRHQVAECEIDMLGHVNNLAYLKWMQDAAVAHSAACGWTTRRYVETGAGWVVRSHRIEYVQSALPDDAITVQTWVAGFKKASSLRRYRIVRATDTTLLAEAETNWAFISFEHRVPRRIPRQIIDDFERFVRTEHIIPTDQVPIDHAPPTA